MNRYVSRCCLMGVGSVLALAATATPIADNLFAQRTREFCIDSETAANNVNAVALDGKGAPWIASAGGIFAWMNGQWRAAMPADMAGPAFAACTDTAGNIWFGAWNGLYLATPNGVQKVDGIDAPLSVVIPLRNGGVLAAGPEGIWRGNPGQWEHGKGAWSNAVRDALENEDGTIWLATGMGAFLLDGFEVIAHYWRHDELRSSDVFGLAPWPGGRAVVGNSNGLDIYARDGRVTSIGAGPDQLPYGIVQCLAMGPGGQLAIGTPIGLVLWDPDRAPDRADDPGSAAFIEPPFRLFHSKFWLADDDVRDVVFGDDGAMWVATSSGVSVIRAQEMTLAKKEALFRDILMKRKLREPGFVGNTRLLTPGDVSTSSFEDDDNDGEYTNHYMVMQALRYAVTKDPEAKERAKDAFKAMELLQEVTNTEGFIARTMVPESWAEPGNPNPHRLHDGNRTYTAIEKAVEAVSDPRNKPVEVRWRKAENHPGWLWKGDTSSDETTGHFFGYLFYYDLVAETEEEKAEVRALVARVTDYLLAGGLNFIDPIDGEHTRWGVWAPDMLYGDLDWLGERNINRLEILSYLKTAHHITGDPKYDAAYRELIEKHDYAEGCRAPRRTEPAMFTHIDDSLLTLAFPALILYEDDPELKTIYREGLRQWFDVIDREYSPFFNFMAGWLGIEEVYPEACVAFLRDTPLDLVEWTVDNTKREDVQLVRWPELDHLQVDRMLPPSERGVMRWDKNPWSAVRGTGGHIEGTGVYYLLPYWLGRYAGYIAAP